MAQSARTLPEHVVRMSQNRRVVVFDLAGVHYTAIKPEGVSEWLVDVMDALGSEENDSISTLLDFFKVTLGSKQYAALDARRTRATLEDTDALFEQLEAADGDIDAIPTEVEDPDAVTLELITERVMSLLEVWTAEADQPIRPTGGPSGSGGSGATNGTGRRSTAS